MIGHTHAVGSAHDVLHPHSTLCSSGLRVRTPGPAHSAPLPSRLATTPGLSLTLPWTLPPLPGAWLTKASGATRLSRHFLPRLHLSEIWGPLRRQSGGEEWVLSRPGPGHVGGLLSWGGGVLGCSLPPLSADGQPSAQTFQEPFELTSWSLLPRLCPFSDHNCA